MNRRRAIVWGSALLAGCAGEVDVASHVVEVETDCWGENERLSFIVPDLDIEPPTCLLDPRCGRHFALDEQIVPVESARDVTLTVWGNDAETLQGYSIAIPLQAEGERRTRVCSSDVDALGAPSSCSDQYEGGHFESALCSATFVRK